MKTCQRSGKAMYRTQGEAQQVIIRLYHRRREKARGSVYLCPECHSWHITHYTYEQRRKLENRKIALSNDKHYQRYVANDPNNIFTLIDRLLQVLFAINKRGIRWLHAKKLKYANKNNKDKQSAGQCNSQEHGT